MTVRSAPAGNPDATAAEPRASAGSGSLPQRLAVLEDLLCRELDCYRDLLDIMLREKELLTRNRSGELGALVEEQKEVVHAAKSVEPERVQALRACSRELGLREEATLREIAAKLEGSDRRRIERLRETLKHAVDRVDAVNRINMILIQNSLSFIGQTVRAILEESAPPATYAAGGQRVTGSETPAWTDHRV
jgi:flagellar biosynthesis/type III secretory pathway chaperone